MEASLVILIISPLSALLVALLVNETKSQTDVPLRYRVREEVPRGTFIADLVKDVGLDRKYQPDELQQLDFRIVAQLTVPVSVASKTGVLSTSGVLDRDSLAQCRQRDRCEMTLDVAVRPAQFFRIVKLTVEVEDINDNAPRFRDQRVVVAIRESAFVGTGYPLPVATDADSPAYGVQRYELRTTDQDSDADAESHHFRLSETRRRDGTLDPRIVVERALDRESRDRFLLQLVAFDGGVPPMSSAVEVVVNVLDSNDNVPVFDASVYAINVTENVPLGTTILRVRALDQDVGANGEVTYRFSAQSLAAYGDLFTIDNRTGAISVRGEIDCERHSVHQLSVVAQDLGPDSRPVDATVVIRVLDINDNRPSIVIHTLPNAQTSAAAAAAAEVLENLSIGSFVAHVSVVDLDPGVNGHVVCNISDQAFGLIERFATEYQVITAEQLDRETKARYTVEIACWDRGIPVQTSKSVLTVNVLDVNDNRPTFTSSTYSTRLRENNDLGARVLQVTARDVDLGGNAEFEYRLEPVVASTFGIDPDGTVIARSVVDRERNANFNFKVVAVDKGLPPLTGTALVVITVDDQNDHPPRFSQREYSFSVPENEPGGSTVGTVSAEDNDFSPNDQFTYSMSRSTATDRGPIPFQLDPQTGVVTTSAPLDRERQSSHSFKVTASDRGQPSLTSTAKVTVFVQDVNDNAPVFEFPTPLNDTVQISNLLPVGHVVTRVRATDRDLDRNARITYHIVTGGGVRGGPNNGTFTVDPDDGRILLGPFRRGGIEHLDYFEYLVRVTAVDGGSPVRLSTETTLRIAVNSSVTYGVTTADHDLDLASNVVLVVAIICTSALVTLALVLLFALVKHHSRRHRLRRQKNRMEVLKALTAHDDVKLITCNDVTAAAVADAIKPDKQSSLATTSLPSNVGVRRNHSTVGNGSLLHHSSQVRAMLAREEIMEVFFRDKNQIIIIHLLSFILCFVNEIKFFDQQNIEKSEV